MSIDFYKDLWYNIYSKRKKRGINKMKVWVVCEDYTNAFFDIFLNEKKANKLAKEIGGYVISYTIENNKIFKNT